MSIGNYLAIGGAVAALGAVGGGVWYVRHLQAEVVQARAERDAAEKSDKLTGATATITERTFTKETIVHDKAAAAVETIRAAPGAADPVAPDVLIGWKSGIDGLRGTVAASHDDLHSADTGRPVPKTTG